MWCVLCFFQKRRHIWHKHESWSKENHACVQVKCWTDFTINRLERWSKKTKTIFFFFLVEQILMIGQHVSRSYTLHAELVCVACSLGLCAEIIQSWGINAHWEENRRTKVSPCARMWSYKKKQKNNNTVILEVQTKQIYYDIKLTYLSFWCFLFLCWTIKTRLHVVECRWQDRGELRAGARVRWLCKY